MLQTWDQSLTCANEYDQEEYIPANFSRYIIMRSVVLNDIIDISL